MLTIEDLAVLELADVAHADLVARLSSSAIADLAVVDDHTLLSTDAIGRLLALVALFRLLSRRARRALLQVLGELDLLLRLGSVLLGCDSLAIVVLELLGLLLAQLGLACLALLGDEVVKTISLVIGCALVLALLRLD